MTTHRFLPLSCSALLLLSLGCRGGGGGLQDTDSTLDDGGDGVATGAGSGGDGMATGTGRDTEDPPNPDFDPVTFPCPVPGSLPFATQSTGFASTAAEGVAAANPRNKDEASDILGNPGGKLAFTTMDNDQSPSPELKNFTGSKARGTNDAGLLSTPLVGEFVSLWSYDGASWTEAARGTTNDFGDYSFSGVELGLNRLQPHYAILEADQTCAAHYTFLLPPAAQVVVTDIDGTMTLADEELYSQIADGAYDPRENTSASAMMNLWADKGYTVIYLTARPHLFRAETRSWLDAHGFPVGPVVSANSLVVNDSARQYKRTWVSRLTEDFEWQVVAAYGNATSDIEAYEDAGIPKDITFIIGENAGVSETVGIDNNDFTNHIADFVTPYPDADPL
jgi:hypothetical protein